MNKLRMIRHELNYLKLSDVGAVFVFLAALIPSFLYVCWTKSRKKEIWLICEDKKEARDNGYCFFKYLVTNTRVDVVYAIDYKSKDYEMVHNLGKTVPYGSIRHWMLYFACRYNISSQKGGKPNAAIGYVLENTKMVKEKFIFLQHGITINRAEWLFYKNTRMRLFICGAKPEYDYVKAQFGYPSGHLKYLGFPRFDAYHDTNPNYRQILLIPSWREWIGSKNEYSNVYEDTRVFKKTEYYKRYQGLLNNKELQAFLIEHQLFLYFYPHRNMQRFIGDFSCNCSQIKMVTNTDGDIRKLLIESAVMITDYSSVALDFAYMKKPILFYQFDEKRFRQAQYGEGYFHYSHTGFGKVVYEEEDVVREVKIICSNHFQVSQEFVDAHKRFFPLCDQDNCRRIYECLLTLE